jgi:hypothetical protein
MDQTTAPKPPPTPMPKAVLCPYCGQITRNVQSCQTCGGHLDALSRQATQNGMGPWQIRDTSRSFHPGCSYEVLVRMVQASRVTPETILRGPTTGQFWMLARRVPGVSHLLGTCHSCQAPAKPDEYACRACGAVFQGERDRQHLGLGPIRPLPGEGSPEMVAARASFSLPEAPMPASPKTRAVNARTSSQTPPPTVDPSRVRAFERRINELRSRVMVSLGANIVLAFALIAVVVLTNMNRPQKSPPSEAQEPLVSDPAYLGPGLVPRGAEGEMSGGQVDNFRDESNSETIPETPAPVQEASEPQPPPPDRAFDITLLAWPDAQAQLEAMTDLSSAESLKHGIELLNQYDQVVGLPEAGRELLDTWTFRLEQLQLNGIP